MSEVDHIKKSLGVRERVIEKIWAYLDDNFHKFTEANRMKIILAIAPKNIPQLVDGNITYTSMQTIRVEQKPLKLDIGEDISDELNSRRN
jgi:hypothetical protein